ncbi:hypothetical protein ZWY2020_003611 [Hordeum vulgare]|nr:hypothetical protein ZWY2020_003611 [Hordeum vulgare]
MQSPMAKVFRHTFGNGPCHGRIDIDVVLRHRVTSCLSAAILMCHARSFFEVLDLMQPATLPKPTSSDGAGESTCSYSSVDASSPSSSSSPASASTQNLPPGREVEA